MYGPPAASDIHTIYWQTHGGPAMPYGAFGGSNPSGSIQTLQQLDAAGSSLSNLDADTVGSSRAGDLIELGFFDTDSTGTITPNIDTTNLFHGTWTPITAQTTIGQQIDATAVGAGLFGFETQFASSASVEAGYDDTARTNPGSSGANFQIVDDTVANLRNNILALETAALAGNNPVVGIRFYDGGISGKSGSRYNTIMNQNWLWPDGGNTIRYQIYDNSGNMDANLKFEFQNSSYKDGTLISGVSAEALIGTGGNNVSPTSGAARDTNDFVATIAYHDGSANLNLASSGGGVGDAILSGLNGSGDFGGANDGNQLTIHSNSGNDGEYVFSGNIYTDSSTSTDLTILKTGTGEQTISGNINTADSDTTESGFLHIAEGTLTLKPGSGKTHEVEYLTGAGTLVLNNTDEATQTIELGFANTAEKKTLSGGITLSGSGNNTIKVGSGVGSLATADAHQEFGGAISGSGTLIKTGKGKLTLSGSNSNDGGVKIVKFTDDNSQARDGGIVVANHANALGTGTVTVEHGKLAVAGGITVTNTIQGQATNGTDQKSLVGGGVGNSLGTITNNGAVLNIGSGNGEIDVVSPGIAFATSMTNGTGDNQVIAGDHNDAGVDTLTQSLGALKINNVGLKSGGVYDWEIANFNGSTPGNDWDVLQFDTLAFDGSGNFDINILSLTTDDGAGSGAGGVAGGVGKFTDKLGTSGFKFLDGSGSNGGGITWGSVTINGSAPNASGRIDDGYFNLYDDVFSYNNSNYYGDWSVYLDYANNDFYMQYSVVPEPSTYIMVAGLLMLPGMSYLRRLRKSDSEEESSI